MNDPQLSSPTGHSELVGDDPLTLHTPMTSLEMRSANGLSSPPNSRSAFRPRSQSSNLSPFQYLSPPTTPTGNSFGSARLILRPSISQSNHPPGDDSTVLSSLGVVANASPLVPRRLFSGFIWCEDLSPPNERDAQPLRNRSPSAAAFTGNSFESANSILRPRIRLSSNARNAFRPSSLSNLQSFRNRSTSAAPRRSSVRPPFFNIRPRISRRGHSPSGANSSGQLMPSSNVVADTYSPVTTAIPSFQCDNPVPYLADQGF